MKHTNACLIQVAKRVRPNENFEKQLKFRKKSEKRKKHMDDSLEREEILTVVDLM